MRNQEAARTRRPAASRMLWAVRDLAMLEHRAIDRKVDRVAAVGIAVTFVAAALFLAVDPVQQVERRTLAPQAAHSDTVVPATSGSRWPIRRIDLGEAPTNLAIGGSHVAYSHVSSAGGMEVVIRDVRTAEATVAYRTPPLSVLGPLAMSGDAIAFERIALADGVPQTIAIHVIDASTSKDRVIESYAAGGSYVTALVRTDGSRVFYVRQRGERGAVSNEIVMADLAGSSRVVWRATRLITALALYGDGLALTLQGDEGKSTALLLDLGSGEASAIEGFAYAYVQALGARGVVVTGSVTMSGQPESWLIAPDGARTRLGSGCADVTMSERVIAMRCAGRLEVRDLVTGESLHEFAPALGGIAAFDGGAVWTEDDELVVLELSSPGTGPR